MTQTQYTRQQRKGESNINGGCPHFFRVTRITIIDRKLASASKDQHKELRKMNSKCNPRVTIMLVVSAMLFACYSAKSEDRALTVEQTIGILFVPDATSQHYLHANSDARADVARIFDDSLVRQGGPGVETIAMLGCIGDDTDADRLLKFTESKAGQVGSDPGFLNVLAALGRMAYRDVARAKEILLIMTDKGYWEKLNMRTFPEALYSQYPELISINAAHALYLLDVVEGRPLRPVEELLKELYPEYEKNEEARKRFTYNISIAHKLASNLVESQIKQAGFTLDSHMRDVLEGAFREHHRKMVPKPVPSASPETQKQPPESPEEMMLAVVTPREGGTEEDRERYSELAREASEAFTSFFAAHIVAGEIDALKGRILDDGKPHAPLMVRNYWRETAQEIERTQRPILDALEKTGAKPDLEQFAAGTAEDGSLIVKIPIPGTSPIVLERWNESERMEQLDGTFAISSAHELVLVMRKIEDVWYWNPFGW